MFEKSMQHKIIKLLITVFMFFLLLNIFSIISFNLNNESKKSKLFLNTQINKVAKLQTNTPEEQKLIFIDNNIIDPDEVIVILKERIVNQFLKRNKIAKAFELANKDLDIKFTIPNRNQPIKDEKKFIKELIKIDPQITLKDDIIEELKYILLKEYREKKQLFNSYDFFVNYKLIHNKIRNSHIYQIHELYKNSQIQNIKYPFYTIVLKLILEDKENEIIKSKEQLKQLQANFNYYNVIENRIKNEKEFENNLIAIDSTLTYQQNLLILKEKIKNQFKEKNQLAKLYDQMRTEIELSSFETKEQYYIQNEEDYIKNFLLTSVNMPTSKEKILEHFQRILLLEYKNKKNILNLYSSYLKKIIDIMLDKISNNFTTWSPTKIGIINKIINNPLFTSFLRFEIEDAQNEIINLKEQIKNTPATLKNLEDTKNELQNDFQNKLKNYFIAYDQKINDLKKQIEQLTKNDQKHDETDRRHDEIDKIHNENDQKHDETDQRHDKNIIDFNKRLQTLTETDKIHDETDRRHDETDRRHDETDRRHDETDRRHDETDRRHDKNIIDFNKRLQTLTETDEIHDETDRRHDETDRRHDETDQRHDETDQRHDKNIIDFNKRLQTLTENDEIHDETDRRHDEIDKIHNENDRRHDENDQRHDENDQRHDETDQRHDETDQRHDETDQRHDKNIIDFNKRLQTLTETDKIHNENDRRHDENDQRHYENYQRHDKNTIDFDKRLKTLTEIDRRQDESIIKFNQRFKTLTKNDQRQNENDRKQDESINKVTDKVTSFDTIHKTLTEDKYEVEKTFTQNIIDLKYKNKLIKEQNQNNQIFKKNNTKFIELAHKYLTNIYSIDTQKWIFLFKKYSKIYLVIITCMINILFYLLLLSNKFKS
ncbi:MAG: hypothetical protein Q8803_02185 [Candidatus Phytoplasma australasiaticum]|uniref:hypothetical protein n=1 Tax=Candidatus Phytoplasma australasiaticum TaxID=2754999 RepID=UPI002714184E|nr:hypothetical protein [Candidatus Phytoplasma australasiaticum]MDO8031284.1 hypothetical protein [Candidatus Phytoplasma australasiaticum]MDO8059860.1 hypothetical protein [Candidatus Phytoplasma australasiaticum]MDV3146185.1 hypothetical protein [Candidatus Phytoplasma australasiaticum]MDV3149992.1 hypothetical protein [Candidatus Phytoplasma australasiaticum]MDV3172028.1 hypothetical protein [Candidatus Phytoplasma australasiaticum]